MPDTIEAEVLEIDGKQPPPPQREPEPTRRDDPWQAMRGRVIKLDRRWWPLWVLLGIVALAIALTVGVVVAAVVIVFKIIGGVLRFLLGTGGGGSQGMGGGGTSLSRRG
ncbi:hypothetical protein OKA04_02005 [Luteolibacter flavescens]|uniref:Uncharacterized protein n=1 Tax=Luteolibacter flavescens TaxID=1859460 RepID=A0ABT3FIU5_9BACT|nr:hypothetical protein [Luteolibacter flavescens]MCW1883483.1 hypothetical protein [Luteolibacter flavescens]